MEVKSTQLKDLHVGDRIIYDSETAQIQAIRLDIQSGTAYIKLNNGKFLYCPCNTVFELVQMHN